jgi:hypothetical protein
MQKYEYKVSKVLKRDEAEFFMNEMAKDGWRVIDTVMWANVKLGIVVTLERELGQ